MAAPVDFARIAAPITEARCREVLIDLVRVPSPLTALAEAEPLLRAFIAETIAPRLRAIGAEALRFDAMGNLIAEWGSGQSGRSLMLIGNAMNQPQATMTNAYVGEVRDGAEYGLPGEVVLGKGASEQKAVLAAMLVALEALAASGVALTGRLSFVCCVSGETGKHDAIRNVVEVEGVRADVAILGGQSLRLSLGNRGRIDVHLTVRGRPAHSSRPHEGCDAVTGAMELIGMLRAELDLSRSHTELGRATMAVTRLQSFPESSHTIQDRVELTLDRRLLPGEDPDTAYAEIVRIARQLQERQDPASGIAYKVETALGPFMHPSLIEVDSPAARLISEAAEAVLGEAPETYYTANAFDQGYLNHVGIACVNYGPGEYRFAHTDLDMASVTRTRDAAKVYLRTILDYLG